MSNLISESTVVSFFEDDSRCALGLASTIFHPQGGGQLADTGFIEDVDSGTKFVVEDVRSRDGIVFHYGLVKNSAGDSQSEFLKGKEVLLQVDEARQMLNSRPFVEYEGVIPQSELRSKQKELEIEANKMISKGGKVTVAILSYEEASEQCGGSLPHYVAKESTPRIVTVGNHSGPCGGTHVIDLKVIISMKVSQIRVRKGMTKVSHTVG